MNRDRVRAQSRSLEAKIRSQRFQALHGESRARRKLLSTLGASLSRLRCEFQIAFERRDLALELRDLFAVTGVCLANRIDSRLDLFAGKATCLAFEDNGEVGDGALP